MRMTLRIFQSTTFWGTAASETFQTLATVGMTSHAGRQTQSTNASQISEMIALEGKYYTGSKHSSGNFSSQVKLLLK